MRSGWQTHKDRQFFFCNYADLEPGPLQAELDEVDTFMAQQPAGSVLILVDVRGVSATRQVLDMFIRSLSRSKRYIHKSVAVGVDISGQRKVLFDAIIRITGSDMIISEDIEKAKNWLVGE